MRFYAIAVSMEDLDKIRSPVGSTEGFDIQEFDKVILVIHSRCIHVFSLF